MRIEKTAQGFTWQHRIRTWVLLVESRAQSKLLRYYISIIYHAAVVWIIEVHNSNCLRNQDSIYT